MNVLIVDDQPSQRTMYRHLLEDISPEVKVTDFGDPVEALLWSQHAETDLLVLDYRMPNMDGLEFARRFRRPMANRDIPIVLVTVVGDEPLRNAALDTGIIDFMVKPVRPRELRARCRNLLSLRRQHETIKTRANLLERQLLSRMRELEDREREILMRLARATEHRDNATGAHLERMARYSGLIAEALGLPDEDVRMIELAAPLHDIGKIGIPDAILLKAARLTPIEYEVMKQHPELGYHILKDSSSRFVQTGAAIAHSHHEHWDGNGYPQGLKGEDIPLAARIVAIADVLDALSTARPYKQAWSLDEAIAYIDKHAGTHFDPSAVSALMLNAAGVKEIFQHFHPDTVVVD